MMKTRRENALELVGRQLFLRDLQMADVLRLRELLKDGRVTRYTYLRHPYRIEDARAYVTTARKWKRKGFGFRLAIVHRASGEIAGGIALFQIDKTNRHAEIGYWLGKQYWGQGLIDEAVSLVLQHAFGSLKLRRVYGLVWAPNTPSCRAVERLGFMREGTLRQSVKRGGRFLDQHVYAILREDFRSRQHRRRRK